MIRILLYDEEIEERRQLCKQILKYYEAYKLVVQISEFEDYVSVLDALKSEETLAQALKKCELTS